MWAARPRSRTNARRSLRLRIGGGHRPVDRRSDGFFHGARHPGQADDLLQGDQCVECSGPHTRLPGDIDAQAWRQRPCQRWSAVEPGVDVRDERIRHLGVCADRDHDARIGADRRRAPGRPHRAGAEAGQSGHRFRHEPHRQPFSSGRVQEQAPLATGWDAVRRCAGRIETQDDGAADLLDARRAHLAHPELVDEARQVGGHGCPDLVEHRSLE